MKYLIQIAWELDGHAGSEVMFAKTQEEAEKKVMDALSFVNPDDGQLYHDGAVKHKVKDGLNSIVYYGEYSCGEFSAKITKFSTYKELFNINLFTRTG